MSIEHEGKILEINISDVLLKFKNNQFEFKGAYFQRRYVYDFNPAKKGKWIRLRTNGDISTLTIKEIFDDDISGTKEMEIIVSNFEKTNIIMNQLGYFPRSYQESYRIEYIHQTTTFCIDFWPQIAPYLEIEASTKPNVIHCFEKLGFIASDIYTKNVKCVYSELYNINLDTIPILKFSKEEKKYLFQLSKELNHERR